MNHIPGLLSPLTLVQLVVRGALDLLLVSRYEINQWVHRALDLFKIIHGKSLVLIVQKTAFLGLSISDDLQNVEETGLVLPLPRVVIRSVQDPRLPHVPHLQLVGGLGGVGGHHDGLEVGPGEGVDRLSPSAGVGGGRLRDIILLTGSV